MTTMTRSAASLAGSHRHAVRSAALVVVFWILAAALVSTAHLRLDALSPWIATPLEIGGVIGVAFVYMRAMARNASVDHALLVGIVWLLLTILTEMSIGARVHHGWFALLGSPAHPVLRNVFLFVWIFAPALFARHKTIG